MSIAIVVHYWHEGLMEWEPLLLVGPFSVTPLSAENGYETPHQRRNRERGAKSIAYFPQEKPTDGYCLRESIDDVANMCDARRLS